MEATYPSAARQFLRQEMPSQPGEHRDMEGAALMLLYSLKVWKRAEYRFHAAWNMRASPVVNRQRLVCTWVTKGTDSCIKSRKYQTGLTPSTDGPQSLCCVKSERSDWLTKARDSAVRVDAQAQNGRYVQRCNETGTKFCCSKLASRPARV